jgi:hypothetical protein
MATGTLTVAAVGRYKNNRRKETKRKEYCQRSVFVLKRLYQLLRGWKEKLHYKLHDHDFITKRKVQVKHVHYTKIKHSRVNFIISI